MESATATIHAIEDSRARASAITLRRGTPQDTRAAFDVMWEATVDLAARQGVELDWIADDVWPAWEGLYSHLGQHGAEWWLAEDPTSGRLVGAARSIERGGMFQLTELHVRPGDQSNGVGRALMERAFPDGRGSLRIILASNDVRALARYYHADVAAQLPLLFLTGSPAAAPPAKVTATALNPNRSSVAAVIAIDREGIGLERETEISWLLTDRQGYLYTDAAGSPVGYAFIGPGGAGPIAAVEPVHLPEILLNVEDRAHAMGIPSLEFTIPGPNAAAMRHLLGRGFRLSPWSGFAMSNRPFGRFDRYICFDPPFIL